MTFHSVRLRVADWRPLVRFTQLPGSLKKKLKWDGNESNYSAPFTHFRWNVSKKNQSGERWSYTFNYLPINSIYNLSACSTCALINSVRNNLHLSPAMTYLGNIREYSETIANVGPYNFQNGRTAHFYLTPKSLRLTVKCTGTEVEVSVFSTASVQNILRSN